MLSELGFNPRLSDGLKTWPWCLLVTHSYVIDCPTALARQTTPVNFIPGGEITMIGNDAIALMTGLKEDFMTKKLNFMKSMAIKKEIIHFSWQAAVIAKLTDLLVALSWR